jgi:hypothetical protein
VRRYFSKYPLIVFQMWVWSRNLQSCRTPHVLHPVIFQQNKKDLFLQNYH